MPTQLEQSGLFQLLLGIHRPMCEDERALNRVGLRVYITHRDEDAIVTRDTSQRMRVGAVLGKIRKRGMPEYVWFELTHAGIL